MPHRNDRMRIYGVSLLIMLVFLGQAGALMTVTGDLNGDEKVTSVDALMALKMSVGSLGENLAADLDGDGTITANDALLISRIAVGLDSLSEESLPDATIKARPASGTAPLNVTFDTAGARGTGLLSTGYSYAWEFGDNTSGTGATIAHVYTSPGTYKVKLTVSDRNGQRNQTSATIIVTGNATTVLDMRTANVTATPDATIVSLAKATPTPSPTPFARMPTPTPTENPRGTPTAPPPIRLP